MAEFCMPSLGADMKAGTLLEWKVKPGDRVKRGDIMAQVETEKGVIEIEIFMDGVVEDFLVQPGQEVPVGTVLAIIRAKGEKGQLSVEDLPSETASHPESGPEDELQQAARQGAAIEYKACSIARHWKQHPEDRPPGFTPPVTGEEKRMKISPSARNLAVELAVDLSAVHGTGPDGAICRADVEQAASAGIEGEKVPDKRLVSPPAKTMSFQLGMRRAIAAAMTLSNREIPHYYLATHIDMSRALQWLEAENRKRTIKERLLPAVLLVKAAARALADVPGLNGYWIDDHNEPQEAIHIGFAISLRQGGLIAPAIHHADIKSLDELMESLRDLIVRTRAGRLRSSEMSDATVTLTNLGELGVETAYGLIYPPQVALISFGKITEKPWVEKSMIGIRQVVTATLAGDHRATDGRTGAQFLDALNRYLQEAEKL